MNNILAPTILLLLFLSSCTKKPLETELISFSENDLEQCATVSCPEVSVDYLTIVGDTDISSILNAEIEKSLINLLYIGDEIDNPSARSISKATEQFIEQYRFEHAEFPDMAAAYFAEISQIKGLSTSQILSIMTESYFFTGGAHGYSSITFLNLNPETGKNYGLNELINDTSSLVAMAEEQFRAENDIASKDGINATGFWFKNDAFYIPENFGFTENALILYFNAYEIAPYVEGPSQLEIPLKEIRSLLTFDLDEFQ